MFGGDELGDLFLVRVHQFPESEQDLHALGQCRAPPPVLEGRAGSGNGAVDVCGGREIHGLGHLSGGRVVDIAVAISGARPGTTGDPMRDAIGRLHDYLSLVVG